MKKENPTNLDIVTWCVWFHYNRPLDTTIAKMMNRELNDPYVIEKASKYRNDFGNFWGWLDNDYRQEFIKMAIEHYNK